MSTPELPDHINILNSLGAIAIIVVIYYLTTCLDDPDGRA